MLGKRVRLSASQEPAEVKSLTVVNRRDMVIQFDSISTGTATEFSFQRTDHAVMVSLGHRGLTKEVQFGRTSRPCTPDPGDTWAIPAGYPATAAMCGKTAWYTVAVPTSVLGDRTLAPNLGNGDPLLHRLVVRMHSVAKRDDPLAGLLLDSLAELLTLHIKDRYGRFTLAPRINQGFDPSRRALLAEFLEDHLDGAVRLPTLAGLVGMTVRNFGPAFTATFGVPPHQYLLNRRIDRAKKLLTTTTQTVTEISIAVGFSTPSHFSNAFRMRTGRSPSDYRRLAR